MSTRTDDGAALCGMCLTRQRAAERTDEWLAEVDATVVAAAVAAAAPNFRQADWLSAALDEGPGILHASTTAPPVVDRLVAQLAAAGVVGIEAPCCVRCGRSAWLSQRLDGHRACLSCAMSVRGEPCSLCAKTSRVTTRTASGAAVCSMCYRKDPARWEACARCANVRTVVRRLDDGTGLCTSCCRRSAVCSICGHERLCAAIRSGRPRCDPCSKRRVECSWCGRTAQVSVVWATGPVCSTCRHKGLTASAICTGCGDMRRPDPRHPSGRCSDCVGLPAFNVCVSCGNEDRIFRAGRCFSCTLPIAFDSLAVGPVDLAALRATIVATDRPRAVIRWLETPFITTTLARLASGDLAITHEAVDGLGNNLAVIRLRGVLVQSGLLAARDEALVRLETWIAGVVAAIDEPDDRRTIDAFATWHVLRRARRRSDHLDTTNTRTARCQVRRAAEFLAFLHDHDRTLATCDQADVELWLTGAPIRRHVADFLKWAQRRRLAKDLDVPRRQQAWPARQVTDSELRALVTRLIDDNELRTPDRVAGLFVVCYGQLLGRVARLRVDNVAISPDRNDVTIRFGRDDVELPAPIAALVSELVATRRGRAATEPDATSPWLFPGAIAGRPLHAETLRKRLATMGIANTRARTATLLDLAAQIPTTVLADMIGLYPTTAARWNRAAGGDWANYAAQRATHRNPST